MSRDRTPAEMVVVPKVLKKFVPVIVVVLIIVGVLAQGVVVVGAGYRGVIMDWGAVNTDVVLSEGLHFIVPIQQSVVQLTVQIQKEEAKTTAASKDLQDVSTEVTLNYHVNPERANKVYQELRLESTERIIRPAIQEAVKASTAQFTAEDLIVKRAVVKDKIEEVLSNTLIVNGIIVDRVSITEFKFSPKFTAAIEAKQEAEQLALKAENDLIRIKVEAEQRVTQAKAEADAILLEATAKAEALKLQRLEVSELLNQYKAIEKWDGELPMFVGGDAIPFIDVMQMREFYANGEVTEEQVAAYNLYMQSQSFNATATNSTITP